MDNVNHPSHYNQDGGLECIEEMLLVFGVEEVKTFCKLNTWKYRHRASGKDGEKDLAKAHNYMHCFKSLVETGKPAWNKKGEAK